MLRRSPDRVAVFGMALVFVLLTSVVATAWNGLLTLVWHPGIHLEQTSVAVNYAHRGLLTPFSLGQSDILHLPPLYSWLTYGAIQLTGWTEAGRLVSILSGLLTVVTLFAVLDELDAGREVRVGAVVLLVTSPLFVLLSGAIMQETLMLLFSTLGMYTFVRYVRTGTEWRLLLTAVPVFLSAFAKWPGVFTLVPIGLFLLWDEQWDVFRHWQAYLVAVIPVSLSLLWFLYLSSVSASPPSGDIANRLIVNMQTSPTETVVRLGRYWVTRFPVTHLVLAVVGVGSLSLDDERDVLFLLWLGGGLSYVVVFLSGAVFHDHYAALMLPPLAVLAALGLRTLSSELSSRLAPVRRSQVTAAVWILLVLGMIVGVATLTTAVRPETEYVAEQEGAGEYVVSGLGNRDILLVISPDRGGQSLPQDVDAVARFVNGRASSHVGLIPREAIPVYYQLSGNLSQVELYSSPPGELEQYGTPSRELRNDPSPADIVVAAKRNNWNGTLAGYERVQESGRFYVLVRTDSSTEARVGGHPYDLPPPPEHAGRAHPVRRSTTGVSLEGVPD